LIDNHPSDGGAVGWLWIEHTAIVDYGDFSYDEIRPLGSTYNADYGMGRVYTYNGTFSNRVLFRGGQWDDLSLAGAFAFYLKWDSSDQFASLGFRCTTDTTVTQTYTADGKSGGGNVVVVSSVANAKLTQNINVGSSDSHDFSIIVKDNTSGNVGGEVDSSVGQLYYNGATISTDYYDMDNGWWRLFGTISGSNETREFGLLIKSGKTVVVDDVNLYVPKESTSSGPADPNNIPGWSLYVMAGPNRVGGSNFITGTSGTNSAMAYISNTSHHDDVNLTITKLSPTEMLG
ncbi:unnamed protein product, partial [marine sediment metagenome]